MTTSTTNRYYVLSTIFLFIFICLLYTQNVYASEATANLSLYQNGDISGISYDFKSDITTGIYNFNDDTQSLHNTIYNGLYNTEKTIDVSQYKLTLSQLTSAIADVVNTSPELFYVMSKFSYSGEDTILTFSPRYSATGETLSLQRQTYENCLNEITALVNPSWSDLEKVVFIHDYIEHNYEFDMYGSIYDCYGFLTKKAGVCQAYALTFYAIMERLGMEVSFADSTQMDHMWNVVKINDNWYHVDTTWDDPYYDYFGYAFHNFLLLSDDAISKDTTMGENHHDWNCIYECSDTTYDNYFWKSRNVLTPFQYLNDSWYFGCYDNELSSAAIFETDLHSDFSVVCNLGNWYEKDSNTSYEACYSGLDVYNGELLFNSNNEIFAYEPTSNTITKVMNSTETFYSLRVDNRTLTYLYAVSPEDIGTLHTMPMPCVPFSDTLNFKGDVNFDGVANLEDASAALKAALGITQFTPIQNAAGDLDNDNSLTLSDVILILKKALGIL